MKVLTVGRVVRLSDPDREEVLAEIRGDFRKLNRLQNVALPTVVDGHRFPSKKEAQEYRDLKLKERAGEISHLQIQVTFPLVVNGVPIFPRGYVCDFLYLERQKDRLGWKLVVADTKGFITETFEIKERLMKALYGVTVRRS